MELHPLRVFLTVAAEKSFSRAAEKLLRTQPAISLSIQRLEAELGDKLIDRSAKELVLTDAGKIVLEYARRFENMQADLENALAELRDKSAGRLVIGANESSTLYLLDRIDRYRRAYPKIKVEIRRSLSSRLPSELLDGDLELGILTYDPADDRLLSTVIYTDHLAFIVSPSHRFASREEVSITELGAEFGNGDLLARCEAVGGRNDECEVVGVDDGRKETVIRGIVGEDAQFEVAVEQLRREP